MEKIATISTVVATVSGLFLALGKAFQVFDIEFKKSQSTPTPSNETNNN